MPEKTNNNKIEIKGNPASVILNPYISKNAKLIFSGFILGALSDITIAQVSESFWMTDQEIKASLKELVELGLFELKETKK